MAWEKYRSQDFAFPNLLVVTIYNRSQLIQDLDEDAYKFINCI